MTRSGAVVMAVYALVSSFAASDTGTAHAQPITEYPIPTAASKPWGITAGPDGSLWFTEVDGNKIGVITTSATFTEYAIPTTGSAPHGIATGPDGNLWFTEGNANKIGSVTPSGVFTEYATPTSTSQPYVIVTGPDGNLWFTEYGANKIAKLTTGGSFTEYSIPTQNSGPVGIAMGFDGNIWFTEYFTHKVGKITPAGVITEYATPTVSAGPYLMTAGPDGNVWFTENGFSNSKVAKITPNGHFTEFPVPASGSGPIGISPGPDGKLWFTERNSVGVITVTGDSTEYSIPSDFSRATSIAAGPDGNLWFTEIDTNIIGRFNLAPVAPPPNDECTSATALSSPPFSTSVDLTGATDNAADPVRSCSGEVGHHNVWFTFTAASTGMLSVVSTAQLTLYTGACGALVEAACGASGSLSAAITAGETYVLEVSGPEAFYSLTATVCGDGIVSGPSETCDDGNFVNGDGCNDHCHVEPPSDECASAIAVSSPPFSTSVDLTGATDNAADPVRSCSGEVGHHNVWFTFTAASTGMLSVVSTAQLTLYTGACGALAEAACGASGSMSVLITAGETYTLEVSGPEAIYQVTATVCGDGIVSGPSETCDDGNLVNGDGCDDHCHAPQPNDECTSATALSSPHFSTSVDLTGATDNAADPVRSCSGQVGHHNVWFTFTAASSGPLSVVSTAQLTLYTGACGALVEAACGASGSLSVLITAGETYTLEVSGPEATYQVTATVCGDGIVSGPSETCDDGNLVNGDGCDDHCLLECPEDLCRCLPNAGKFSVVGGKVTGALGKSVDSGYPQGADIRESICAITGKFSGRLESEFYLAGDAILTSGVGTTAVRFRGYKLDGAPTPGVYIDGDVATGGGFVKNPQNAAIGGATDTSGTNPKVATCQQALSELTTASATLASLAPTQTLGSIVVAPDDTATITVGPGRQVVNIDSIKLKSRSDYGGFIGWSELDFVLDPATTVLVVNIAKGLSMGALGVVSVEPWDAPPPPGGVIFNFLPGASLSLGTGVYLPVSVLAPTAKIRALAYAEDTGFGDLYTTKAVKLKGAYVPGYLACP